MWKIRKAILTGGGRATRLRPITTTINKHLLPLANKPIIFHAIEKAVEAGIEEIFINTNPGETELQKYIGDGGHWGIKIKFFEQTGGPQGIAHVVNEAKKFIGDEPFLFYLSDNVILGSLKDLVQEFSSGHYDCMLTLSEVPDARSFGVPVFNTEKELVDVWEKPPTPPNNFAVTGIYLYGPKVFFDAFQNIERSARGEYEISSIHSHFLKNKMRVGYKEITGWWKDTGVADDLILASRLILDEMPNGDFRIEGNVDSSAKIVGKVHIGVGTFVGPGVVINGPAMIGENCRLENCLINSYATLSSGTTVKQATIGNSIVLGNCEIDCPININNSLIGANVKIKQNGKSDGHRLIVGDHTSVEI